MSRFGQAYWLRHNMWSNGAPTPAQASRHSFLYFSLASLTTMGEGDATPVSQYRRSSGVRVSAEGSQVKYIKMECETPSRHNIS